MMRSLRSLGGWVGAILVVAVATSAQADLLSVFTFDEGSGNPANSVSGVSGGTLSTNRTDAALPTYVAGPVGNAMQFSRSSTQENWVDATTAGFPKSGAGNGWSSGTLSLWVNCADTTNMQGLFGAINTGSHEAFILTLNNASGTAANSIRLFVRTNNGSDDNYGLNFPGASPVLDGQWHQLVVTYDIGDSSHGGAMLYIDGGNALALTVTSKSSSSVSSFNAWGNPVRIGSMGRTDSAADQTGLAGAMDDVAVWNNQLNSGQAKAIYNLAMDSSLNYGVLDAQALFDVFATGPGSEGMTSDGQTWQYITGLTGAAGEVIGHSALILDGSGNGVQIIPEPATVSMALMGLAALVRRRR